MSARPRLKRQCRPLRRGEGAVQLGLDPEHGVVLEGLTDAEISLVERLDGTHDRADLAAWAQRRGVSGLRVAELLELLSAHFLTVDTPADRLDFAALPGPRRLALEPDAEALACAYRRPDDGFAALARRARRAVVVDGRGSLPAALAQILRQAGVGSVMVGPYAVDAALGAGSPSAAGPDLAVLVGSGALDSTRALGWQHTRTTHLPVVLQGTCALVGPLVEPGETACLHCMDLTRADLDPGWPVVLAQLVPDGVGPGHEVTGESALVHVVAGVSAMVVLAALDGHDQQRGVSLEVALPWPRLVQRRWAPHPVCGCGAADTLGGPALAHPTPSDTMAG